MAFEITTKDNKTIKYEENFWTGKKSLTVDGESLKAINRKTFTDGTYDYVIKGNQFTGLTVTYNDTEYTIIEKLSGLEIVLCCLPLLLIFSGGAIGGAIGGATVFVIMAVIRSCKNLFTRILCSVLLTVAAFIVYYLIVAFILVSFL